jgi:hypothetical protein
MKRLVVLLIAFFVSGSPAISQKKLKQGIEGKVFWIEGNQMPNPDKKSPQEGVQREIFVYELTRLTEATHTNGFFSTVSTKLVTQTQTGPDGSFKIKLPPGRYSVFVKEPNGLFANLFDSNNLVNPVIVKPNTFSWLTIAIDYQATY